MAIRYVIRREKNAQDMLHYGIFTLMFTLKTFKSCSKKIQFCLVCFFSSRPLAEYSSWMFLTTKHPYRVNKFIINWFADKKNYTERPSIVKGIFSLGYPCVNSTLMSNFSNPSPQVPLIWHADNFATIWNSSSSSLGTISSAQQTTKGFCLNLWSRI